MGQITNYSYYSKVCEGYAHNYVYTFCMWGDRPHAVGTYGLVVSWLWAR